MNNVLPPTEPGISAGFRAYLYVTAALTGGAILIVEILGAKMLAPYVGTSHFVWTAQIAVTLFALAVGYYAGGWLADRRPNLGWLYAAILVAAGYLCLSVVVILPVVDWCLKFELALGSLLSSLFLFFLPLSLLAMVAPFLVRVIARSVSGVGGTVGRLTAVSTLGSVAGTVLISYVLIPRLPNSVTMYSTAAALMAWALGYFVVCQRKALPAVTLLCFAILRVGFMGLHSRPKYSNAVEIYRANSNFGSLEVVDKTDENWRLLLNDYVLQNLYDPVEKKSRFMFSDMLHALAHGYTREVRDVLCVGMGVGIVPMRFAGEGIRVDVVEINPALLPLAVRFFDLQPERMNIVTGDGRYFIRQCTNRYDAILLDAFLGDSLPFHLMTREALEEARRVLTPGGTLIMDTYGEFERADDFLFASVQKTLKAVFRHVKVHRDTEQPGLQNVFFVASDEELTLRKLPDIEQAHPVCRRSIATALAGVVNPRADRGIVLTDDFNPVDYYDAINQETYRRETVRYIRSL